MEFTKFQEAVYAQFQKLTNDKTNVVLRTDAPVGEIFDIYLEAWPEEHNQIFREKREHDCNCCKSFIRAVGNLVAYVDGELVSVWDIQSGDPVIDKVAATLKAWVLSYPATTPFYYWERRVGTKANVDTHDLSITWNHFYADIPSHLRKREDSIASLVGKERNNYNVLKRSITEITPEAVATVLELIENNSLYRGTEHKRAVLALEQYQTGYSTATSQDEFLWNASREAGPASGIRNTVIGTLLTDISEGKDLEGAVKAYEVKVAPANYKRTSSLITQAMINRAQDKVVELGYANSIQRRHATIDDLTINNVKFADRSTEITGGIFGNLTPTAPVTSKGNAKEVTIDEFMKDVLPATSSLELLLENAHESKLMTLVAPLNGDAPSMLSWDNNFSWTYNGDVTDSMREAVVAAGGRVDGVLRFTHSWNHNGDNQSLMDLHVFLPTHGGKKYSQHKDDEYGNNERVGWNRRKHPGTRGVQDVDFTSPPGDQVPLENITFPELGLLPNGDYQMMIHNWQSRQNPKSGFKAEIEFGGEIHQYEFTGPVKHKEWIPVATVNLKKGQFTIEHHLQSSSQSKEVWGITTQQFHKVKLAMLSPNHWDDNANGNKHYFFTLDKCANPNSVRGFYNEFLDPALRDHRKVFEHLGSQMKAPFTEEQLSGVGFSSTIPAEFTVRADGRMYKVTV